MKEEHPNPKDTRSPLSKARDAWMQSEDFTKSCDLSTLLSESQNGRYYLSNRLESAFAAGAAAQRAIDANP